MNASIEDLQSAGGVHKALSLSPFNKEHAVMKEYITPSWWPWRDRRDDHPLPMQNNLQLQLDLDF